MPVHLVRVHGTGVLVMVWEALGVAHVDEVLVIGGAAVGEHVVDVGIGHNLKIKNII